MNAKLKLIECPDIDVSKRNLLGEIAAESVSYKKSELPDVMERLFKGCEPPWRYSNQYCELQHRIEFDIDKNINYNCASSYLIEVGNFFTLKIMELLTSSSNGPNHTRWCVTVDFFSLKTGE